MTAFASRPGMAPTATGGADANWHSTDGVAWSPIRERNRRHAPKGVVRTLDRLNEHARNTGWVIALDAGDLEVLHQMFA